MQSAEPRLVGVSDVSIGYGSPQVPRLMQALAEHFNSPAIILEPDEREKRPAHPPAGCHLERIPTIVRPHSGIGRRAFVAAASRRLNELRPDLLVLFCTYTLPVLSQLRQRPRWTLYLSIESISAYGARDAAFNRRFADQIDVVVFPEENRAGLDVQRCGLSRVPMAVMYNTTNERDFNPVPVDRRRAAIIYTGTLDPARTLTDFFFEPELNGIPIDLFGNPSGRDPERLRSHLNSLQGSIRYHGYVPAETLRQVRSHYAYSLVLWAPTNENQLYAAPNKFFDAIADGLPPIVGPHPQCKEIINRYGCGILMDDWSFPSFLRAVRRAMSMFGTPAYDRLVTSCRHAVECELNWPAQFEKVKRLLPDSINRAA